MRLGGGGRLRQIDSPDDPELRDLSALMNATFADPNTILGLDRMQEFLAANRPGAPRRFYILVATDPGRVGAVVGGTVFSYVPRSNCGFSEYMLADRAARGTGIGRVLFDGRKEVLHGEARRAAHEACRGVFIEVDHPDRVPADLAAIEAEIGLDGWERLRLFDHFGFRHVAVPYVQPPLALNKQPIDYLDLLFAPWQTEIATTTHIPTAWILETLEAIWSAWTPDTAATYLERLAHRVTADWVALEPISIPSS